MGRIFESLHVWGNKGGKQIENVLFDGGASHSVIREDISKEICRPCSFQGQERATSNERDDAFGREDHDKGFGNVFIFNDHQATRRVGYRVDR